MKLADYLAIRRARIDTVIDAITRDEVNVIGIGWPLESGWKQRFAHVDINDDQLCLLLVILDNRMKVVGSVVAADLFALPVKPPRDLDVLDVVEVFADGECKGGIGCGKWSAVMRTKGVEKKFSGSDASTTINRMELMAAIQALELLKRRCRVVLSTKSKYVQHGMTNWVREWKRHGWRGSSCEPVKNEDLWRRLDAVSSKHEVDWVWGRI